MTQIVSAPHYQWFDIKHQVTMKNKDLDSHTAYKVR